MDKYLELASVIYPKNSNYHSFNHIKNMLYWFSLFKDKFKAEGMNVSEDDMRTAILYHDAVYIPGAKDNEYESVRFMNRQGINKPVIEQLIMSTIVDENHINNWKNYDIDCKIMHDLDWFGFSIPTGIYAQTMSIINEVEYFNRNKFTRKELFEKRAKFLKSLFDIDIFQTKALQYLNQITKENIKKHYNFCITNI